MMERMKERMRGKLGNKEKTEEEPKSNEQEVLSASVTAQVLSYVCNLVKYSSW